MKLGHASMDNTPDYPVFLSGYPRNEKAKKIHLPIEIHALCIELAQRRFCLAVLDTLLITSEMCDQIRKEVSQTQLLAYEDIHICATHTHSAPCLAKLNIPDTPIESEWLEKTIQHCVQVMIESTKHMEECECYFAKKKIEGFYGNRNDIQGLENKNAYVFSFYKQEHLLGRFISLSCHNTVNSIDNNISSDLFGAIRSNLHDGFTVLANGASGDISTRHYRQGCDCKEVDRIGKEIADILVQMERGNKVEETAFIFDKVTTHAYQDLREDKVLLEKIAELEEKKKKNALEGWDDFTLESYHMRRNQGIFRFDLETSIMMNAHYMFLTIPGELLTVFDQYFREKNPNHQIIFITTCDGYAGYLVADDQYRNFEEEMAMVKSKDVWNHIEKIQQKIEEDISTGCGKYLQ